MTSPPSARGPCRRALAGVALAAAAAPMGCGRAAPAAGPAATGSGTSGAPLAPTSAPAEPPVRTDRPWVTFADVTKGSGLEAFHLHAGREPPKNWVLETIGGGLAVLDADGDGDLDVFLADGADLTVKGDVVLPEGSGCRLFRNDGGFRFTDVTRASGAGLRGYWLGAAAADYDGDGDTDLCAVGYDVRALLRNRGDGTFEDVTAASGLAPAKWEDSSACAWGDVDGDGRLDLYVANYSDHRKIVEVTLANAPDPRWCERQGRRTYCGPDDQPAQPNRLFLQRADGTFEDASGRLNEPVGPSFQPVLCDLDGDGDLDVYVPNDGRANALLVNDGRGRFADAAVRAGVAVGPGFKPQASMGVAVADWDGDLRPDLALTHFSGEINLLLRNRAAPDGGLLFEDVSLRTGFARGPQDRVCWGVGLVDFDQDGVLDGFVSAGNVFGEDELGPGTALRRNQTSRAFRGLGPPAWRLEDVTDRSGPHFRDARLWRGTVFPDLDGDGDPDVLLTAQHAAPVVLRNDGGERNAWIRFDLRARAGLPTPAGARVTVTLPGGARRTSFLLCGSSHEASDDPRVHFGLGAADRVDRAEVRWPDGTTTELSGLPARRVVVVRQ